MQSKLEERGPGWSGCASLPANIFLDKNGNFGVKPIDELKSLRSKELLSVTNKSITSVNRGLAKVQGDLLEVIVELEGKDAKKFGVSVLKSPDDREHTLIYYDAENKKLKADGSNLFFPIMPYIAASSHNSS